MKNLLGYLKRYRAQSILAPLFKLFEVALELAVPFIVSYMIDNGIKNADRTLVIKCCALLVLFAAVGFGFAVVAQYFAAKAATGFAADLRNALYTHIGRLSYSDLDRLGTSSLITNMTSDVTRVQTGVNLTLRLLLRSPFVVFGAVIACFAISVRPALSFAAAVPVLLVFVYLIMLFGMKLYSRVQSSLSLTVRRAKENLDGVRVIRAFGAEDDERAKFSDENESLCAGQKRSGRLSALLNPVTFVIVNIAVAAMMYSGAIKVNDGALTQGETVAMYNLTAMVLVELIKLADLTINITKALSSGKRLSAVLAVKPSVKYGAGSVEPAGECAVKITGASLSYGGKEALSDINMEIKTGQTVGIIGGTGSGKSSLIALIARFYDCDGGSVELFGNDVREYSEKQLRALVGAVPQRAVLFEGTLRENLKNGVPGVGDDVLHGALEAACADDFVEAKGGLDCRVEPGGRNFSGGQKQRLAVARALLRSPSLLILDDSSSALDYATDARMRGAIKEYAKDMTVIVAAQRVSSVRGADVIYVMDDGRIIGFGTHEELLSDCPRYAQIYASQTGGDGDE
ncbi:MAG: ABC transporter ATP-binding protein [Clostridia bacterium]|nr:ABC transporter ATP-binding protein [Clostridia bacterium]